MLFSPADPAIDFGLKVHPICLPVASNTDPNKWRNQDVDILGFSTLDKGQSINRGDRLKVATMTVFNQTSCNTKLDIALNKTKKCKYLADNLMMSAPNNELPVSI